MSNIMQYPASEIEDITDFHKCHLQAKQMCASQNYGSYMQSQSHACCTSKYSCFVLMLGDLSGTPYAGKLSTSDFPAIPIVPHCPILKSKSSRTVKIATRTRVKQTSHRTDKNGVDKRIRRLLWFSRPASPLFP